MLIKKNTRLVITNVLNTKISKVENKMTNFCSLVTTTVVNTKISEVNNKLPNHDKYITAPEFNTLTENFTVRLMQANLEIKTDFDKELTSFNRKITSKKNKIFRSAKETT